MSLNAASYASATLALLVLAALLLAGWRGHGRGTRLILAVLVSIVWAGAMTLGFWQGELRADRLQALEWLRLSAWVFALTGFAAAAGATRLLIGACYALAALGTAVGIAMLVPAARQSMLDWNGQALVVTALAFPIVGLILIEQLSRNANADGRRALLPLLLGVGGILVCDLALYAELLLDFRLGSEVIALRGFANAACVPAIALAARRNPDWSIDVFVSRHVVYYSATLLAVGSYLLLMAAGGYLVASQGGEWGEFAQWVFLTGAATLLVTLVASDIVRKRLRAFLNTHFYRNKYDYRLEWLRFVDTLEVRAPDSDALPAMVRAVAQIIGSHSGVLWTRSPGENRLVPAASWSDSGQPLPDAPMIVVDDQFLGFLEQRQWIVDLDEYRDAADNHASVALPAGFTTVAGLSLIVPLMQGARLLGLMGLTRPDEPFVMHFEDRDLLKTVGRHVGTHLAQFESDQRLTESRQFEAYTRLTAFVMHDLKNLLAQLSLVVANADKHRRNPAFVDDAIDTIRHSTERMTRLIEQLNRGEFRSRLQPVALRPVLERVVERTRARAPVPVLEHRVADAVVAADPDRLMTAIEHLVRNAQDATPKDGRVMVRLDLVDGRAVIQVTDTGSGMSAEFVRERLFRPFDSTKGAQGMGIGAYQVRDYVRSLRGQLAVDSRPGGGSEFTISLPVVASEEH